MRKFLKKIIPDYFLRTRLIFKKKRDKKRLLKIKKGDTVICPICKYSSVEFGRFGVIKRDGALCYNCNSLERHRLMFLFITKETDLFRNKNSKVRLLHFAPELYFYKLFCKNSHIEYSPCDLFPKFFNYEGPIPVSKVDITEIPYNTNSFDFILCSHVLEHIPNDLQAMKELYRVMDHGGKGIFQVPIDIEKEETYEDWSIVTPIGREKAFGQSDHVRWYGKDYTKRLESVGFRVEILDYVSNFSDEDILKFGLMRSEKIFLCSKD